MAHATLPWLAEELAQAVAGDSVTGPTYAVEVYCGDRSDAAEDEGPWGWVEVAEGLSLWGLLQAWRVVHDRGWSEVSVYVSREDW